MADNTEKQLVRIMGQCVLKVLLHVRDVGIGMHAKHLRGVVERQAIDVSLVVLGSLENRDVVALVEDEAGLEHELSKPTLHVYRMYRTVCCIHSIPAISVEVKA